MSSSTDADETLAAGFRRSDVVRLVTQCLNGLGYEAAAAKLESESGIALLAEPVSRFRQDILEGQWDAVDRLIDEMQLHTDCRAHVRFLVCRQKYLELLEAGNTTDALKCLRQQLAPLEAQLVVEHAPSSAPPAVSSAAAAPPANGAANGHQQPQPQPPLPPPPAGAPQQDPPLPSSASPQLGPLQELSCLIMCGSINELKARAGWEGTHGGSRAALLQDLQRHIPPSLLLPENRLLTLLQQAVLWQTSQCFDQQSFPHGAGGSGGPGGVGGASCSLFEDFSCSRQVIPRETRHVLEKHSDEVWYVSFSHDGARLASASKDSMVVVWEVATMSTVAVLAGHTDSLAFLAWSPDDTHLLTCGNDRLLKLWLVSSGQCVRTFSKHTDNVTACAWLPDGRHFISAGIDKYLHLWDGTTGQPIQSWHGPRVNDLAVSHSGAHVVAICAEKKIRICELGRSSEDGGAGGAGSAGGGGGGGGGAPVMRTQSEQSIDEVDSITSLSLSRDSRHVLVNTATDGIHNWDLQSRQLIREYRGQKQVLSRLPPSLPSPLSPPLPGLPVVLTDPRLPRACCRAAL